MQTALIYVTAENLDRYTDRCAEYCNRLGLRLAAVVVDELDGGRWPEVAQMLMDGTVQVVVVADRDELPPDRTPRVDVVAEQRRRLGTGRSTCRPRLIR
ncbi:hypothetical protein E0H26_11850 [Micromonospora zingiberis]|uniref:Resolvase/invertase-type recombinase catalytic domain-containing protein n=1 Tax=Micromonospora zingiberis TaxID=2053011 RepID=A0A4R0GJ92_9ACTN|nr:hypothetical protein [Micromonospora zingiberis]TCB97604.1 hypothetical protein E0H26_11850 [Micromonospora zingiberis]